MMSERRLRGLCSLIPLLLFAVVATVVASASVVHAQSSTGQTAASASTIPPMRALAPPIVTEMDLKEQLSGILLTRVVTLPPRVPPSNKPVLTGLTTDNHKMNSKHRVLQQNQKLEFSVDDSSPQEIVITVKIDKSVLAGNPQDPIHTDYMSIGFLRGNNTCWQECWREGGKKICDQVCY